PGLKRVGGGTGGRGGSPRGEKKKTGWPARRAQRGEPPPLEGLRVRRSAGVRIAFRGGQHRNFLTALIDAPQCAIPEANVAFPIFEIALRRKHQSEPLSAFAL